MNAPITFAKRAGPLTGPHSAGISVTPDEYEAIPPEEWKRGYRYEVIHRVLVVSPPAGETQADPNDELGHLLRKFKESHPNGKLLDKTTFERQVRTSFGYRVCDRALWIGFGRKQMTVYFAPPASTDHRIVAGSEGIYTTPLLPGFELPLDKLLSLAEEGAESEEE